MKKLSYQTQRRKLQFGACGLGDFVELGAWFLEL
jgi:hypothetical protein